MNIKKHALTSLSAIILLFGLGACTMRLTPEQAAANPQDIFWKSLQQLCHKAFAGKLVHNQPSNSELASKPMVMHVRECSDTQIKIPLHVAEDHSRTWILTRTQQGLRLKHDHRHADGMEDTITQYGGDSDASGTDQKQIFPADAYTAQLLPAAATNIWALEVQLGKIFIYELKRAPDRHFRIEFDLTQTVDLPPTPWGY